MLIKTSFRGCLLLVEWNVAQPLAYHKLRNKVHKLVGRVNGRFGSLEHAPIVYLDQSVDFADLCALYFP